MCVCVCVRACARAFALVHPHQRNQYVQWAQGGQVSQRCQPKHGVPGGVQRRQHPVTRRVSRQRACTAVDGARLALKIKACWIQKKKKKKGLEKKKKKKKKKK